MLTRGRGGFAVLVALIGSLFAAAPVAHADPPVCLSWTSTGYCKIGRASCRERV